MESKPSPYFLLWGCWILAVFNPGAPGSQNQVNMDDNQLYRMCTRWAIYIVAVLRS